jgi:Luciferase-like monooxygenase/Hsp20/alpha crystallin family
VKDRDMVKLGYKLMAEEHGPASLVRNTVRAEQAGFAFAAISDHFFPWLDEQGHAPFAWSVLGAAAQATRQIQLMTAVTCPIMRYHPAITVQENVFLVTGNAQREEEKKNGSYLHRGIARRAFERRFSLADHMRVMSANLDMACSMSTWFTNCRSRPSRARSRSARTLSHGRR